MTDVIHYYASLPLVEWLAVLLSLLYVVLAAKENIWCWPAAFISTAIYSLLFFDVNLLMDSLLNGYYLLMAIYGFWQWRAPKQHEQSTEMGLAIRSWSTHLHFNISVGLLLISLLIGAILSRYTSASFPYLDSITTVFALFATYLVTQKVLENWLYWIVIDAISIYLYLQKNLLPTAALFVVYVIIALIGYWNWRKHYYGQTTLSSEKMLVS